MQQLTAKALSTLLTTTPETLVVDVRELHELAYGKIDKALHIPLQQIPNELEQLGDNFDRTIVFVCHAGMRSLHAAQYTESLGYNNIINLVGGTNSWAIDIDKSMSIY
jgi:rhodanese-related sulfurtransferase